jgi:outer membrane receptor protein involved in Fe transport
MIKPRKRRPKPTLPLAPLRPTDSEPVPKCSTVTDLRVRRQITPKVALTVDLLNVFDRKYYDIAYGQDYRYPSTAQIVPDSITVHPGEPRQVRVTLQVAL